MKKLNGIKVKEILINFINVEDEEYGLDNNLKNELFEEIDNISNGEILFEFLCNICVELGFKMGFEYGGDIDIIESVLYELGLEEDEVMNLVDGYVNN